MVQYRRHRVPGGTYFFTVNLADRQSHSLVAHVDILRACFSKIHQRSPFHVDAIVVLPDHLHAIWTLPPGDHDYSGRWQAIKAAFTRALISKPVPVERHGNGEYRLWQRRYWEHTVRNEDDFRQHVEYIWFNPVKHGHVTRVIDWPHSSFHRDLRHGLVAADWGGRVADEGSGYGE